MQSFHFPKKIVVVGAGIGGLTFCVALHAQCRKDGQAPPEIVVLERASSREDKHQDSYSLNISELARRRLWRAAARVARLRVANSRRWLLKTRRPPANTTTTTGKDTGAIAALDDIGFGPVLKALMHTPVTSMFW